MAYTLLGAIFSLPPYHLLSWGSLLGMELYQSFFMTKICFIALPMPQFTSLQKRVFPVYFSLQLGLVLLTAVTYPPQSLLSLVQHGRWSEHASLAMNVAMAVLNTYVYGPRTQRMMIERAHQETKDKRKHSNQDRNGEQESVSQDMILLKRGFSRSHAMAIHLNAIAMAATVWYGFSLASRLNINT